MFLEERLLEIGRRCPKTWYNSLSSKDYAQKLVSEMWSIITEQLKFEPETPFEVAVANVKRVDRTWRKAVITLKKEGIDFLNEDAVKDCFVKDVPFVENIIKKIAQEIWK